MREIILDTETTGMDPYSGHRIIEIGCIEMISRARTGKFFHTYLNPERDVPIEAERVHGISTQFLLDKPVFSEKVDQFLEFVGDARLVIHNASFDMRFLNAELEKCGFAPIAFERATDTVLMARKKFPGSPANLDALCKRFSIDLSARTKHGALLDAELLAEVYIELMGGRQVVMFGAEAQSTSMSQLSSEATGGILPPRIFSPTPEELAAHAAMLAQLKNPLWSE
jgi:DNA polymerase III subunit epsilon